MLEPYPANSLVPWMPQPVSSPEGAAHLFQIFDIEGHGEAGPLKGRRL